MKDALSDISLITIEPEPLAESSLLDIGTTGSSQITKFKQECLDIGRLNSAFVDCEKEPFSCRINPTDMLSSLTTHWLIPPDMSNMCLSSIRSIRAHYVTLHHPYDINMPVKEAEEQVKHKNLFEKYEHEFQETCKQS